MVAAFGVSNVMATALYGPISLNVVPLGFRFVMSGVTASIVNDALVDAVFPTASVPETTMVN